MYWTLGQYDQVCVVDAPAASVLLAADMLGNIRTQKWAFTASKMGKILAKVPGPVSLGIVGQGLLLLLESVRYLQSVRDHSVEQLWDVVVFDEERRTKPLRMILRMLANPFTCPLSEWPNEGKRALWQNPDIGLTS